MWFLHRYPTQDTSDFVTNIEISTQVWSSQYSENHFETQRSEKKNFFDDIYYSQRPFQEIIGHTTR